VPISTVVEVNASSAERPRLRCAAGAVGADALVAVKLLDAVLGLVGAP
jgi:hypothetical protein